MEVVRWVLVAGTGRQHELPRAVALLAAAFGRALAEQGFGLVVGGWPGVDYLVAQGYAQALAAQTLPLADYLIQVVADSRPGVYPAQARYPYFQSGYVVAVPTGVREWVEALKYADAVVLLGGEGGTRQTFWYATQEQRPVFPVFCTGGDAALVFADCVARWELFPDQGFTAEDFTATLAQPAADEPQARELAAGVLRLLQAQFKLKADARAPIFISYAHEDQPWLLRLRSALRPLEHWTQLAVWDDHRLQAGDVYKDRIVEAIARAPVAIFIVSSAFFASTFIQTEELARLLEKSKQGTCRLLWLLVDGEEWRDSPLYDIQALNDVEQPLGSLSPAQQQDALIVLRRKVAAASG